MDLRAGVMLGPYQLQSRIGAGGMGEVYRAVDSRIGREVAIKVLSPAVVSNADRLSRFALEARAAGAINHPNVATVYDVGSERGTPYLVTELVEGESLRARLAPGPLPASVALDYAIQIAHGLAAAHDKGIVHRDLKPENVLVARDGRVRIVDFGVAKLIYDEGGAVAAAGPTIAVGKAAAEAITAPHGPFAAMGPKTDEGVVVGTAGYMAPEQVRGARVDTRADIFAFGAILAEMLTGRPVFRKGSRVETMEAILQGAPASLGEGVENAGLDHVVRHCLEQSPDARFQSASDLAFHLEATRQRDTRPHRAKGQRGRRSLLRFEVWALGLLLTGAALGIVLWRSGSGTADSNRSVISAAIQLGSDERFVDLRRRVVAISPDGSRLVYEAMRDGVVQLFGRRLNEDHGQPIAGTQGAFSPFFSPNARWIGFFTQNSMRRVPWGGGGPVTIHEGPADYFGGTWGDDDTIVFSGQLGGLWRLNAGGGTAQQLTHPDRARGEKGHRRPEFVSGGHALLFTSHWATLESFDDMRIETLELGSGTRRTLVQGGFGAEYAESGHLVFGRGRSLFAAPFDRRQLALTGPTLEVMKGLTRPATGNAHFALSKDGTLIVIAGGEYLRRNLVCVDRYCVYVQSRWTLESLLGGLRRKRRGRTPRAG